MCKFKENFQDSNQEFISGRSKLLIDITPIYALRQNASHLFEKFLKSQIHSDPAFTLILEGLRRNSKTVPIPIEYIDDVLDRNVDAVTDEPIQTARLRIKSYPRAEPLVNILMSYLLTKTYFSISDLRFIGSSTNKYATSWFRSDIQRCYIRVFRLGGQFTLSTFPVYATSVAISSFDRPTVLLTDGIRLTHAKRNKDIQITEADPSSIMPDKPGRVEALLTTDNTESVEFVNDSDSSLHPNDFTSVWDYWMTELRSMPLTGTDGVSVYRCEKNRAYCFYLSEGNIRYMLIRRAKDGSVSLVKISPNRGLIPAIAQFVSKFLFRNIK